MWVRLLLVTGCLWWAKRRLWKQDATVVLMLHRVLNDEDYQSTNSLSGIVLRESTFRDLAEYVARHYELVSLSEAKTRKRTQKLRLAFTFDDGWRDNYSTALAIASAHPIPLTVFLCPGLVGAHSPFWPERLVAALRTVSPPAEPGDLEAVVENLKHRPDEREQLLASLTESQANLALQECDRLMSWDEIRAMKLAGVEFGSHTHTHQILTAISGSDLRREIRECKTAIEQNLGGWCDTFAYPNGDQYEETRRALAQEGYRLAFTTERGAWTPGCDPLRIPRANVSEDNLAGLVGGFSPAMFEYTALWKSWRATKTPSQRGSRSPQGLALREA
jgi:peptidoglycan/xylan/chitin deacetylase (PgdA/CDA1 family)